MRSYREQRRKSSKKTKKKERHRSKAKKIDKFLAICAFVILFLLALSMAFLRDWYL